MESLPSSEYLREEELLDSLVVDSEGYVCGRVGSFDVEPDRIMINLYDFEAKKIKVPDEEKLLNNLIEYALRMKLIGRRRPREDLYKRIREDLGLSTSERITLRELLRYAELKNIEIPAKFVEKRERVERGKVDWRLIDKIGESDLGKCILLKEPVEARKRGVEITDKVPYYGTEYLSGRMVIDAEAQIIGSAEKILLRIGASPGLLIKKERVIKSEVLDIDALIRRFVPSIYRDEIELYKAVAKELGLKGRIRAEEMRRVYITRWAEKRGIEIPKRFKERRETIQEIPGDWECIKKIGDVILLNKSLEDLMKPPKEVEAPKPSIEAVTERAEEKEEAEEAAEKAPVEAVREEEEEDETLREEWWKEYLNV